MDKNFDILTDSWSCNEKITPEEMEKTMILCQFAGFQISDISRNHLDREYGSHKFPYLTYMWGRLDRWAEIPYFAELSFLTLEQLRELLYEAIKKQTEEV